MFERERAVLSPMSAVVSSSADTMGLSGDTGRGPVAAILWPSGITSGILIVISRGGGSRMYVARRPHLPSISPEESMSIVTRSFIQCVNIFIMVNLMSHCFMVLIKHIGTVFPESSQGIYM